MFGIAQKIQRTCAVAVAVTLLAGCSSLSDQPVKSETIAASVYERNLLLSEIENHIPNGTSPEDSVAMASRYVDQWIREQVMIHQAERRLPDGDTDFSRELEAYRNALLLHAYKDRYVNERLETSVSDEEAVSYYERNKASFILTDYSVRVLFVSAPASMDEQMDEMREAMASLDSSRFLSMERWCVENGATFSLADDIWWTLGELTKEIPLELYRAETQIARRRPIEFEAEERIHLVRFLEHALKNDVAPFEAVRNQVDELILHQRRKKLLMDLEENLLVAAWSEGAVQRAEKGEDLRPMPSP
jgi:outer membrane murein-binding lipoprotein Lpp